MDPIRAARRAHNGKQPGDPARLADAILHVMAADNPPVHLILGTDALTAVAKTHAATQDEIHAWRHISESTAYPS